MKLIYKVDDAIAKVSHQLHRARVGQRKFGWSLKHIHENGSEFGYCTELMTVQFDLEQWRDTYMAEVIHNGNYDHKPTLPKWTHTSDYRPKALIRINELIESVSEYENNPYYSSYEERNDYTFIRDVIEEITYQGRGDIDLTQFADEDTPQLASG